jgi:hypothetical protein
MEAAACGNGEVAEVGKCRSGVIRGDVARAFGYDWVVS